MPFVSLKVLFFFSLYAASLFYLYVAASWAWAHVSERMPWKGRLSPDMFRTRSGKNFALAVGGEDSVGLTGRRQHCRCAGSPAFSKAIQNLTGSRSEPVFILQFQSVFLFVCNCPWRGALSSWTSRTHKIFAGVFIQIDKFVRRFFESSRS